MILTHELKNKSYGHTKSIYNKRRNQDYKKMILTETSFQLWESQKHYENHRLQGEGERHGNFQCGYVLCQKKADPNAFYQSNCYRMHLGDFIQFCFGAINLAFIFGKHTRSLPNNLFSLSKCLQRYRHDQTKYKLISIFFMLR